MKRFIPILVLFLLLGFSRIATAQIPLRVNYNWYPRLPSYSFYGFGIYSFTFPRYNFEYPIYPPVTEYRPYENVGLLSLAEAKQENYFQTKYAQNLPPIHTLPPTEEKTIPPQIKEPQLPDISIQTPQ